MEDEQTESVSLCEANVPTTPQKHGFGIVTIRRLAKILKIIFSHGISILFLSLICLMALLEQYLVYNVGIIPSGFYKVLGDKNFTAFWYHVIKATLLIIAICFVLGCKKYILNVFYVSSREILTEKLHTLYFSKNKFFVLNTLKYDFADNPDQRITQDVEKFCKQFSSILSPVAVAPFTIAYYSYNCFQTTGWVGPVSVFVVFVLSVLLNRLLMKPIVGLVVRQEQCEGFFRFKHMHVRSNAESIAFQGAHYAEMTRSNHKLLDLVKTQQTLYLRQFPLDVCVSLFAYAGSILSYLILAWPVFAGDYDGLSPSELSALISVNAFVAIYLISCFSSLINISTNVSELVGLTHRVSEIMVVLKADRKEAEVDSEMKMKSRNSDEDVPCIDLQNVTFAAPRDSRVLVRNLSLQLKVGCNVLITGKSSSGKTSLFRIIRGLWPTQEGQVVRGLPFLPSLVFFLPQHPLLSDGSLIQQIVYPLEMPANMKPKDADVQRILGYIERVDLGHLLKKAGLFDPVDWTWSDVLSPGEAQRLSFVRLFVHHPRLAFLDEATSALGQQTEKELYVMCRELGITTVSIGHRPALQQFHDTFLHLDGEGGWTLTDQPSDDGV